MGHLSRALAAVTALTGVVLLSGCQPQNTAAPAATGDTMLVTEVVDGDTFRVVDGRTIRVLGIDSCEAQTPGGQQATAQATGLLRNKFVTLSAEPGVDVDVYGRQLRYVTMQDGQDFGQTMIPAVHTGLYDGGDAAPQRIVELTALDVAPQRQCGDEPAPTTTPAPPPPTTDEQNEPDPDLDRPRTYVPAPDPEPRRDSSDDSGSGGGSGSDGATKPRSGQSGHPCLPGERDGDNDGYCGEGR